MEALNNNSSIFSDNRETVSSFYKRSPIEITLLKQGNGGNNNIDEFLSKTEVSDEDDALNKLINKLMDLNSEHGGWGERLEYAHFKLSMMFNHHKNSFVIPFTI